MALFDRFRKTPEAKKAVYGGVALTTYQQDIPLSAWGATFQNRAAQYLAAYGTGWFNKAGRRISTDLAGLMWTLAYEDVEGDNEEDIVAPANNIPFDALDPLEQFLRLSERPNPYQTGRNFKAQQQIRLDFTGRALVYLEGADDGGLPTAFYGVSPTRMTPSRNAQGQLIGWVLDAQSQNPVPFTTDEIVAIEYAGPMDDPMGVVEAVYAQVPLSTAMARHTADVLATGGRLAGMMWPKDRALSEDEFTDAQRAWRNLSSDPNAARRLLLMPEPMEYAAGAATPVELGIPDLANLSMTEILTAFPINPFILGVPVTAGMNSGDMLRYVRKEYQEGTIHPRAETWEDAFQTQLIPRYEAAVGRPLDFDIEEPNLDDAAAIIEKVGALKGLVSIGFDPKEAVAAVALDHIQFNGVPTPEPPPQPPTTNDETVGVTENRRGAQATVAQPVVAPAQPGKAYKAVADRRKQTIGEELPGFQQTMKEFLVDQRARLIADIEAAGIGRKARSGERMKASPEWWNQSREDSLLKEALRGLYLRLARSGLQVVADDLNKIVMKSSVQRVTELMLTKAATRITGINETTRDAVQQTVTEGVRRGYSIGQIANGVEHEAFTGLNALPAFDDARAELVARTETMLGYNESALRGYQEFDVGQVEAIDGDDDPECAERDGQVYSVDDALEIEDHPNGTLDWIPLTDKAVHGDLDKVLDFATKALELAQRPQTPAEVHLRVDGATVNVPALEPPTVVNHIQPSEIVLEPVVVHAEPPVVNIGETVVNVPEAQPVVNVAAPNVTVEAARAPSVKVENKVQVPEQPAPTVINNVTNPEPVVVVMDEGTKGAMPDVMDVRIVDNVSPPRERKIKRDARGLVTGSEG